jgi:hypothetical protein
MGEKEENEIDQKGVAVDKRVICLCYFLLAGSLVMDRVGPGTGCIERESERKKIIITIFNNGFWGGEEN